MSYAVRLVFLDDTAKRAMAETDRKNEAKHGSSVEDLERVVTVRSVVVPVV
jgi:hypothetical protein